jgi:hypothetical protein
MKTGDIIMFNFNPYAHKEGGHIGLITKIVKTRARTGQIHILSPMFNGTIQWAGREKFAHVLSKN